MLWSMLLSTTCLSNAAIEWAKTPLPGGNTLSYAVNVVAPLLERSKDEMVAVVSFWQRAKWAICFRQSKPNDKTGIRLVVKWGDQFEQTVFIPEGDGSRSVGPYEWKGTNEPNSERPGTTTLNGELTVSAKKLRDAFKKQKLTAVDRKSFRLRIAFDGDVSGLEGITFNQARVWGRGRVGPFDA